MRNSESAHAGLLVLAFLFAGLGITPPLEAQESEARLYYFWQEGCPHCTEMSPWLDSLEGRYPGLSVSRFEVRETPGAIELLRRLSAKYGIERIGVPSVFLGHRAWVGFNPTVTSGIERAVAECVNDGCLDALRDPLPGPDPASTPAPADATDPPERERFASLPLFAATALIALLDGVNPCSLWVLTFLLGMVVHTGSRRKMLLVGSVFLTTTALVYGLFIIGVVQALDLLSVVPWIRVAVAVLAFVIGALGVKEFFAFGRGPSLTVGDTQKRKFGDRVRRLLAADRSPIALSGGTALLAAGIALVELPCTAGFPVVWGGLVTEADVGLPAFGALFALYLLVYLADEAIIVGAATVAFKRIAMTETRGRRLKLSGGVVMIALGAVMLVRPALIESLAGTAVVFGAAIGVALVLILVDARRGSR
ncbi:MAG: hypothetical protein ACOC37_03765 [Spirochaetota bacterium]